MKVLLDACVWSKAAFDLRDAGLDVVSAGEWPLDPGDDQILVIAHAEGRIRVTLDKDFGELAIVHGRPHHGIVRLVGIPARRQASSILKALFDHGDELQAGGVVTVEAGRTRFRPPDGTITENG